MIGSAAAKKEFFVISDATEAFTGDSYTIWHANRAIIAAKEDLML